MSAISSTTSAQSAAQAVWQQLKLQQAQRNAERAEQTAHALQAQAANAQQVASDAQQNAQVLSTRSNEAQSVAGQARQGLAIIRSVDQMQTQLSSIATQVVERGQALPQTSTTSQTAKAPVVNTQGQVTGTVINTTA